MHPATVSTSAMLVSAVFILAISVVLDIYILNDLYQPTRHVRGGDKQFWAVIIVLGSIIGVLAYLSYGREEQG